MLVEIIGKCINADGKSNFSSKSPFLCLRRRSEAVCAIFSRQLSHYRFLWDPKCSVASSYSVSHIINRFAF